PLARTLLGPPERGTHLAGCHACEDPPVRCFGANFRGPPTRMKRARLLRGAGPGLSDAALDPGDDVLLDGAPDEAGQLLDARGARDVHLDQPLPDEVEADEVEAMLDELRAHGGDDGA